MSINLDNLNIKLKEVVRKSGMERAANQSKELVAKTINSNTTFKEKTGELASGFKLIAEGVKVEKKDVEPIISELTNAIPGIDIKKVSSKTTEIETLTGKKADGGVLDKVMASPDPKGVGNALEKAIGAAPAEIEAAVVEMNEVSKDPITRQKFEDVGISGDTLDALVGTLSKGSLDLVSTNFGTSATKNMKLSSKIQMKELDNPFGSFTDIKSGLPIGGKVPSTTKIQNPFGSLGVDFGNIMGNISSLAAGQPTAQSFGDEISSIKGAINGINPVTNLPVPNIINRNGTTDLAKVVSKGNKTNTKATTPVDDIVSNRAIPDLSFKKVSNREEFELELKQCSRELSAMVVDWTGSFLDENLNAKQLNKRSKKNRANKREAGTIRNSGDDRLQSHYVILRDGTVERCLPVSGEIDRQVWQKGTFVITFVAGYNCFSGTKNYNEFLSPDSLTEEQYLTFDEMIEAFFSAFPGGAVVGLDAITLDQSYGPGFNCSEYIKKFGKVQVYDEPNVLSNPYSTVDPAFASIYANIFLKDQ